MAASKKRRNRGVASAPASHTPYDYQVQMQTKNKAQDINRQNDTGNLSSKPKLIIPHPSQENAAALHDEMDTFSFKNSALSKYKLSNELLENVMSKLIPFNAIAVPDTFPKTVLDGALIDDVSKLSEEELVKKVEELKATDIWIGSSETLKLKAKLILNDINDLKSLKAEEPEGKESKLLDSLLTGKHKYQVEKFDHLRKLFHNYNARDLAKYEEEIEIIDKELKEKFKLKVVQEAALTRLSHPELAKELKVSISYDEMKKRKEEAKLRLEELERKQKEEAERQAEELRKKQEEEEKRRLQELAETEKLEQERQRILQEQQQQQLLQQQQQQQQQQPFPYQPQPTAAASATASADGDNRFYMDPFGSTLPPQGSVQAPAVGAPGLSFPMGSGEFGIDAGNADGLLYDGGEDLMMDDGSAFGALDDQVFLSNLDGNLD